MPSQKQHQERKENISAILQYLRTNGPKSRREISGDLSLSWGCVSELASILLSKNILLEDVMSKYTNKGRVPTVLRLNPDNCFLGVDINMNGLKGCICNLLGEKIEELGGELKHGSKSDFIDTVTTFINSVLKKHKNICGIGFAMQGILDSEKNIWEFPAKESIFIDFAGDFDEKFDIPLTVEHDPNCILYGCLDTNDKSNMIVRLDRGIGAAIYRDSAFLKNDLLEIGYLAVDDKGTRLHDVVSLNAIKETLGDNKDAQSYNEETIKCLNNIGKHLGIVLGNICNLLHLDRIYICGDMVAYYDDFFDSMMKYYESTVLHSQKAEISAVNVADAAYGAAKMAMDTFEC